MKRTMVAAVALAAGAAAACGGTKEARRDVAAITPGVEERQEGVVSSIDEEWLAVTLADRPLEPAIRFRIDDETRVKQGDETLDRSAIEQGEVVRVSFESRAGDEQAKAVEILEGDEAARIRARASAPPAWPRPEPATGPTAPSEPRDDESRD